MKKILTLIFTIAITGSLFANNGNLLLKENFNTKKVSNIELTLSSEQVTVSPIYGDEITVEVRSNNRTRVPVIYESNGTLIVQSSRHKRFGIADYCYVDIYIPHDYNFESVSLQTSSGKLSVESVSADICTFKTSSGSVEASRIESTDLQITCLSGRISLIKYSGENMSLRTSSGSVKTRSIECDYFDVRTSSGSIDLDLLNAPLAASQINSSSGSVDLIIPDSAGFDINVSSSSGNFKDDHLRNRLSPRSGYRNSYYGGGPEISVHTSSGSIYLGK